MPYAKIVNNEVVSVHVHPSDGLVEVDSNVYGGMIVVDGDYQWPAPTAEQLLESLRIERDGKLLETDWWASSDLTMTDEQIAYRQALRDITNTYSSLEDVVWPDKPE